MPVVSQQGGLGTLAHQTYVGYAGELRPVPTVENATLFEIDRDDPKAVRIFAWRDSAWHFHSGPVASHDHTSAAILAELRKLRSFVEQSHGIELTDPGE